MGRTIIRSLLSSLIALCLLLGPPRTGALTARVAGDRDQPAGQPSSQKDGDKDTGESSGESKDAKDARDGKDGRDGKESEAATAQAAASLPRQLPGASRRASGTISPLPRASHTLRHAPTDSPPPPLPTELLPRRRLT